MLSLSKLVDCHVEFGAMADREHCNFISTDCVNRPMGWSRTDSVVQLANFEFALAILASQPISLRSFSQRRNRSPKIVIPSECLFHRMMCRPPRCIANEISERSLRKFDFVAHAFLGGKPNSTRMRRSASS